jgi:antitoxin (DNA-binding transcriptional repressor) of toxin-antitoxin stability system
MKLYTYSTARQRLAEVLEEASREGEVQIRRQDGRVYAVTPVAKPAQSPFANVTGQPAKGVTSKDLLRAVRDEVGTWGAHASERPSGSRTLHSAGAFGPCRRCDGPGQLSACTQCARLSCEGIMKHTRCGWRAFVVLLAVDLSACAGPNAARGQTVVRDNVDRYVEGEMRQRGIPGVRAGEVFKLAGYGTATLDQDVPVAPRTVFSIASVDKQFTALAVMLLVEEQKVSLTIRFVATLLRRCRVGTASPSTPAKHTSGPGDAAQELADASRVYTRYANGSMRTTCRGLATSSGYSTGVVGVRSGSADCRRP